MREIHRGMVINYPQSMLFKLYVSDSEVTRNIDP